MTSDIREKILKLRGMTPERGASESEALAALEKADRLMREHGITEDDLARVEYARDMRQGGFKYRIKTRHPVSKFCGGTIAAFCNVKSWYSTREMSSKAFGFHADVEMYEYLTEMITNSMERGWRDYLASHPPKQGISRHSEYWSFTMGFCRRVNEKIEELIAARTPTTSTGTDLVVKKMEVVEAAAEKMLPGLNVRNTKSRGITGYQDVYEKGKAAGDKVNLNRPLTNGDRTRRLQ